MLFSIDPSSGSCIGEGASADALPLWYGDFGDPVPVLGDAPFGEPASEFDQPCMLCASMLLKCFDSVSPSLALCVARL